MTDSTRRAPERALVHPVWWGALALLAFNDHVLKAGDLLPAAVTGKLSDVAGLVVAPLLFAVVVRARSRRALAACHIAVGAVFAGIQLSLGFAEGWSAVMGMVGAPWRIVSDPTDLLALPALGISWAVLVPATEATAGWVRRGVERIGVAVGMFFCVATSAVDPCQEDPLQCPSQEPVSCVDNDGDGVCRGQDCNDDDPIVSVDGDGDGFCGAADCDDTDAGVHAQCCLDADGDGICAVFDCDDQDPGIWDCCIDEDGDGFCVEDDCNDLDGTVATDCTCDGLPTFDIEDVVVEGEVQLAVSDPAPGGDPICLGEGLPRAQSLGLVTGGIPGELRWVTLRVTSDLPASLLADRDCYYFSEPDVCVQPTDDSGDHALLMPASVPVFLRIGASAESAGVTLAVTDEPLLCGDGLVVGPEQCDDGNLEQGDGCDASCTLE